jgi:feruloyl esterase
VGRGGKLLLWHGWSDGAITPGSTIDYYNDALETTQGHASDQIRLFMSPGVHHCGGGEGASQIDFLSVIEEWVERGTAPERIAASRPLDNGGTRTRLLCPYPQVATYTGAGSSDDARNFVCAPAAARVVDVGRIAGFRVLTH